MKIVLDTNVIVSGLLRANGPPGTILRAVAVGTHRVCYDDRILQEYVDVLHRPKFAFDATAVQALLDQIEMEGVPVVGEPLPARLPDADDEMFLEVAVAAGADFLVSGNLRHFPVHLRCAVRVLSPTEFVAIAGP